MCNDTKEADEVTRRSQADSVFKELNGRTINLHTNLKGKIKKVGKGKEAREDFLPSDKDITDEDLKIPTSRIRRPRSPIHRKRKKLYQSGSKPWINCGRLGILRLTHDLVLLPEFYHQAGALYRVCLRDALDLQLPIRVTLTALKRCYFLI